MPALPCFRSTACAPALLALAALALPAHAAGSVDVRFVEPERWTDAGPTSVERERTQAALAGHLRELAQRLPDGQQLAVEVLDVDLAGRVEPGPNEQRVLRGGADVPRIELRYALTEAGRTLASGQARLTDLDYLRQVPRPSDGHGHARDLRLLDAWFEQAIVRKAP